MALLWRAETQNARQQGRVEIALRTAGPPDGITTLRPSAADSGAEQVQRVELLPAR